MFQNHVSNKLQGQSQLQGVLLILYMIAIEVMYHINVPVQHMQAI